MKQNSVGEQPLLSETIKIKQLLARAKSPSIADRIVADETIIDEFLNLHRDLRMESNLRVQLHIENGSLRMRANENLEKYQRKVSQVLRLCERLRKASDEIDHLRGEIRELQGRLECSQ